MPIVKRFPPLAQPLKKEPLKFKMNDLEKRIKQYKAKYGHLNLNYKSIWFRLFGRL